MQHTRSAISQQFSLQGNSTTIDTWPIPMLFYLGFDKAVRSLDYSHVQFLFLGNCVPSESIEYGIDSAVYAICMR